MAENKQTGGPAFPTLPTYDTAGYPEQSADGMSLRDWFAGQALMTSYAETMDNFGAIAREAYALADAMLAERSKP